MNKPTMTNTIKDIKNKLQSNLKMNYAYLSADKCTVPNLATRHKEEVLGTECILTQIINLHKVCCDKCKLCLRARKPNGTDNKVADLQLWVQNQMITYWPTTAERQYMTILFQRHKESASSPRPINVCSCPLVGNAPYSLYGFFPGLYEIWCYYIMSKTECTAETGFHNRKDTIRDLQKLQLHLNL